MRPAAGIFRSRCGNSKPSGGIPVPPATEENRSIIPIRRGARNGIHGDPTPWAVSAPAHRDSGIDAGARTGAVADRTDPVQRASGRAGLPGSAPTGLSCVDRPLCTRIVAVAFSRKNDYFYVVKEHKASKMHFDAIVKALDRWFCFATAYPADNLNDAGKPPPIHRQGPF